MADSPLVKGKLTWHMSQEMWDWLKSQPNQAHVLREALEQYKKQTEE